MFQVGYLVLKENINKTTANDKGNFEPNWLGPFVIIKDTRSGAYKLPSMDGK